MKSEMIDSRRLKELEHAEFKLHCLEAGGVDNWVGYSDSLIPYFQQEAKSELVEDFIQNIQEVAAEADVCVEDAHNSCYIITLDEDRLERLIRNFLGEYDTIKKDSV